MNWMKQACVVEVVQMKEADPVIRHDVKLEGESWIKKLFPGSWLAAVLNSDPPSTISFSH